MVADQLRKFSARFMKQQITEYLENDGSELLPIAKQATRLI